MKTLKLENREPTSRDLAAIEAEWPVIAAGLVELDAEIAALAGRPRSAVPLAGLSELDRRRVRRETSRLTRLAAEGAWAVGSLDGAA